LNRTKLLNNEKKASTSGGFIIKSGWLAIT
jgi:hypothetical protein